MLTEGVYTLFINEVLDFRVAYFNELDTFAQVRDPDTGQIIDDVCGPRIGLHHNTPILWMW